VHPGHLIYEYARAWPPCCQTTDTAYYDINISGGYVQTVSEQLALYMIVPGLNVQAQGSGHG